MATIYLGLGSNVDPEANLRAAVDELRKRFRQVVLSPVYQSAAVGFEGDDFLNLVARVESDLGPREVIVEIEAIHDLAGRRRSSDPFGPRVIDVDLLLYGDLVVDEPGLKVPRKDVLEYGFVLKPLSDIAPDLLHPVTRRTISDHWQEAAPAAARLDRVDLSV